MSDRKLRGVVLERKARPAAKLLMTANGRCNFTRDLPPREFLAHLGEPVASFAVHAIEALPPHKIAEGFHRLGVAIERRDDARLFPASGQAATIVHALGDRLRDQGVPICCNATVTNIERAANNGWLVYTPNFTLSTRFVLIATGGASFPKTGSVGDGQNFARSLGHRVEPLRAALIGYDTGTAGAAVGRDEHGAARILKAGRVVYAVQGEVDFERWGVSGGAVYNASRYVARQVQGAFTLEADYFGKTYRFESPRPRPLKEAIVTMGGVALDEVNPLTMESKVAPGVFFAGEVMDVDGPTGGYNLTLAFATARCAVVAMAAALGQQEGKRYGHPRR